MPAIRLTTNQLATENTPKKSGSGLLSRRHSSLMILVPLLGLLALCFLAFCHNFIPSESMEPNLRPGDHILTMRSWLAFPGGSMPARGDLIVFSLSKTSEAEEANPVRGGVVDAAERKPNQDSRPDSAKNGPEILIKRVVGLPGDSVQVKGNDVYVNGVLQKEHYSIVPVDPTRTDFRFAVDEPLQVPAGRVFVLGDNRNNSDDGRFWGTLDRKDVLGKFIRVLYHENKYDLTEAAIPVTKRE